VTNEEAVKLWASWPPEQRLAMAKSAPRVAGKWEQLPIENPDGSVKYARHHEDVWLVTAHYNDGRWHGNDYEHDRVYRGDYETPELAQAACDAALIAAGWVLDNQEKKEETR
jgi:hypothetical protein